MTEYHEILNLVVGGWGSSESQIAEHLEFIEDVELSEPDYSFHELRIYVRRSDGAILWATDSGCSCPSPFEDTSVADLKESTASTFIDAAMRWIEENEYARNTTAEIRRDLSEALDKARKAGAR